MEIEYKEFGFGRKQEQSLSDIVKTKTFSFESGAVEISHEKANAAIEFTEKVVELLHEKGLLSDKDIAHLVAKIIFCDKEDVRVVK
jgi:predicted transcriptional regulator YheO